MSNLYNMNINVKYYPYKREKEIKTHALHQGAE